MVRGREGPSPSICGVSLYKFVSLVPRLSLPSYIAWREGEPGDEATATGMSHLPSPSLSPSSAVWDLVPYLDSILEKREEIVAILPLQLQKVSNSTSLIGSL